MKKSIKALSLACLCLAGTSCGMKNNADVDTCLRYQYPNILNISVTPEHNMRRVGCFTDAGSWMGFTIPEKDKWINGFCGPFSIDNRVWFAKSAVSVNIDGTEMTPDSISYFPGEIYMTANSENGSIEQRMVFVSANTALLNIKNNTGNKFSITGKDWNKDVTLKKAITLLQQTIRMAKPYRLLCHRILRLSTMTATIPRHQTAATRMLPFLSMLRKTNSCPESRKPLHCLTILNLPLKRTMTDGKDI